MIGNEYWATGIRLRYNGNQWSVSLEFYDNGWCDTRSTEGVIRIMRLRYYIDDLVRGVKILEEDAKKLGIVIRGKTLYIDGDGYGEDKSAPLPDDWREIIATVAQETGFENIYNGKPRALEPQPCEETSRFVDL